ncbi:SUKH-3 domain-containing protein [Paenibacillus antibioticophila]|uniref:SUKH-3 domain-containing protein n=1 Tax=Paenibacillus antibioticophila TaxID=1274374 RepID=UPI0006775AAD|nr:SUKH-3 domain-containing protein [Paenibacillus antibioticophila]
MERKIREILQNAGWFEGRNVDISGYVEFLNEEEYFVFERAADFLTEYGGLTIQFENPKRLGSYLHLTIDPINAGKSILRELSKRYENHCKESFVIIGEVSLMDMTWYISSTGAFYGGNDDFLIRLGDNFCQSVLNLISGEEFEVVTIEDE